MISWLRYIDTKEKQVDMASSSDPELNQDYEYATSLKIKPVNLFSDTSDGNHVGLNGISAVILSFVCVYNSYYVL